MLVRELLELLREARRQGRQGLGGEGVAIGQRRGAQQRDLAGQRGRGPHRLVDRGALGQGQLAVHVRQ
ncbi:MAG: hypothetical protein VB143_07665 [Burkholderia sp.]